MAVMEFATFRAGLPWRRSAGRPCVANSCGCGAGVESVLSKTHSCGALPAPAFARPIPWLHPLDGIGVNGVHALVVAPSLVRVEMFRRGQTYDVLISRLVPRHESNGKRPALQSTTIFHAEEGYLQADLAKGGRDLKGSVMPAFYSRAGELLAVPGQFESVIKAVTMAVRCFGCSHSHYVRAPEVVVVSRGSSPISPPNAKD